MRVMKGVLDFFVALASLLFIPESKQEEIRKNFPDDVEQKQQSISYWMNTDPLASWRRLITALERSGKTVLANSIRRNAEPLAGSHTICITGIMGSNPVCVCVHVLMCCS